MSRYDGGWSERNYAAARATGAEGCLTSAVLWALVLLGLGYGLYQLVAPHLQSSFEQLYRALGGG